MDNNGVFHSGILSYFGATSYASYSGYPEVILWINGGLGILLFLIIVRMVVKVFKS